MCCHTSKSETASTQPYERLVASLCPRITSPLFENVVAWVNNQRHDVHPCGSCTRVGSLTRPSIAVLDSYKQGCTKNPTLRALCIFARAHAAPFGSFSLHNNANHYHFGTGSRHSSSENIDITLHQVPFILLESGCIWMHQVRSRLAKARPVHSVVHEASRTGLSQSYPGTSLELTP